MSLLDFNEPLEQTPQVGAMCPKCLQSRRRNIGKIEKKQGSNGQFLGCSRFPDCVKSYYLGDNLNKKASSLLKKKKTRRGKKKKPDWVLINEKKKKQALEIYKKQSKERWQQYQEFKRHVLE